MVIESQEILHLRHTGICTQLGLPRGSGPLWRVPGNRWMLCPHRCSHVCHYQRCILSTRNTQGRWQPKEKRIENLERKNVNTHSVLKLHTAVQHKKADCFVLRLLKLTRMRTDFSAMVDGTNNSSQPRCFICSTISISSLWPQIVHILFNFVKVFLPKTLFMFQEEKLWDIC